jgi:hypothetical protein
VTNSGVMSLPNLVQKVNLFRSLQLAQAYRRRADRVSLRSSFSLESGLKDQIERTVWQKGMWNRASFWSCTAMWNRVHQNET